MLAYRVLPLSHRHAKLYHSALHTSTLLLVAIAIAVVYYYHDISRYPHLSAPPHSAIAATPPQDAAARTLTQHSLSPLFCVLSYTLHSWCGLLTVALFLLNVRRTVTTAHGNFLRSI